MVFANNTSNHVFFFVLITDLYILISVVNAQIFNLSAELAILAETSTNEANAEMETYPLKGKMQ